MTAILRVKIQRGFLCTAVMARPFDVEIELRACGDAE